MTISFFQSVGRLQGILTQTLEGLTSQAATRALEELRYHPAFHQLESLRQLTEPVRLVHLLFHDDHFDAVAAKLGLPSNSLRTIFEAETRANRLLPESAPRLRLSDVLRETAQAAFEDAANETISSWKASNVRRIAPRRKEPIGLWTIQRTIPLPNLHMIVESLATISEHTEGVEDYHAQFRFKVIDWEGQRITDKRVADLVRHPILEVLQIRDGSSISLYGVIPGTLYPWQAWWTRGELAIIFTSEKFHRKKPENVESFFRSARETALDILGLLIP